MISTDFFILFFFFLGEQRRLICHVIREEMVGESGNEAPRAGLGQRHFCNLVLE